MNRNDYHLLETPKDFEDFWSNWEIEDVLHGDFQKGDIVVQVFKPDIPSEAMVFDEELDPGYFCGVEIDACWRKRREEYLSDEGKSQWTYKRVKESDLFFKENITDRVAFDERFPLKRGDLIDVRVGKGKWCFALFLGLDEDWFEKGSGPTYSIYLCNKTIREALGDQMGTCRRLNDIDYETKIIRVRGNDWTKQRWRTADLLNAQHRTYDVRWRLKK